MISWGRVASGAATSRVRRQPMIDIWVVASWRHNDVMATLDQTTSNLTIRALPTRVRATLAARARARRQSLNAYLLDVLSREASTPTMAEVLEDLERIRRPTGLSTDDAVAAVRAARDAEDARWR